MVLSSERESELIEENMPKIYRAIDNFMVRCPKNSGVQISYDDCVQEVSIAFLQYIRKCETEEQLRVFPWYDAMHAMSNLILKSQPFSIPMRTSNFSAVINSLPATVSYDVLLTNGIEVDGMSKHWVPDKDTEMDFSAFMSSQEETVQRIASMRIYGMTMREIAGQFGVHHHAIEKRIKNLRKRYDEFDEEDLEHE